MYIAVTNPDRARLSVATFYHTAQTVKTNVVRNEFLRRFDRLVKGRKVEERNTVRKNPFKGKIVTSHIHAHTKT